MGDSAVIFTIVAGAVALFMWGRLPVMLVALGVPLALFFSGLLPLDTAFSGFGDTVIVFIAGLFVVAAGLEAAGITAWVGQWLSRVVGASPLRLSVLTVLIVALLSPLISMSGAVAALVPVVTLLALRMKEKPSRFLMPLAFASGAGSKLALTGTPKNVLINDASLEAGYGGFGFFEFAWVGIPLLFGTIVVVALAGRRLLPDRTPASLPDDLAQHASTLAEQYGLAQSAKLFRVEAGSPLAGRSRGDLDALVDAPCTVVSASGRDGGPIVDRPIAVGDFIVVRGPDQALAEWAQKTRLAALPEESGSVADVLFNEHSGLAEVVIKPRSKLIGKTMAPGMMTDSGELIVVAIQRNGVELANANHSEIVAMPAMTLQAGDHLLLQGTWQALNRNLNDPDVLVVDSPEAVRRQAVALGPGSTRMIAIVAAMVLVLATGILPAPVGVLLAAMAVVATGILTVPQAYRAIDWNTVVLVASMMPLSTAMYKSGAATQLAEFLVSLIGDAGPAALLVGLFVFTAVLGQVISNTATAMILIPIAVAAALELEVSVQPVLMSLNVGASAAFLTPVATPPNLIVMGAGGYRFGDYWKLGLVLMLLYFAVAVFWVPLVWRF